MCVCSVSGFSKTAGQSYLVTSVPKECFNVLAEGPVFLLNTPFQLIP